MKACFIGHRNIVNSNELVSLLSKTVEMLINKGVTTFLFGSKSRFDELSLKIVTEFKKIYPFIQRVYVRSAYQHIDKPYEDYLLTFYDKTYFPAKLEGAGKCSYVKRNYEMIDNSSYCVFYYNENYIPKTKNQCKLNMLGSKSKSGTKIAYNYAKKKKKEIINLFKQ